MAHELLALLVAGQLRTLKAALPCPGHPAYSPPGSARVTCMHAHLVSGLPYVSSESLGLHLAPLMAVKGCFQTVHGFQLLSVWPT